MDTLSLTLAASAWGVADRHTPAPSPEQVAAGIRLAPAATRHQIGSGVFFRELKLIAYSITKSVSIDAPMSKVFAFLADLSNWPQWAVVNVKSLVPAGGDWWDLKTAVGGAKMRMRADAESGVLDHDFDDTQAQWTVPARVVPNGTGCDVVMTFFQPPMFSQAVFQRHVALVDDEFAQLKTLMET